VSRSRVTRLEKMFGTHCPDCAERAEPLTLIEQIVIVRPGDPPLPPAPEPPPSPERCPRCGRDWSYEPRIIEQIILDWSEVQP
jgi:hypothetical protein